MVRNVDNWLSLTGIDLNLDGYYSSTDVPGLRSLFLDFGRLKMLAKDFSRGGVKDVTFVDKGRDQAFCRNTRLIGDQFSEISGLSELTFDDLTFIQYCRPIMLKISRTLQGKDDKRLTSILLHSPCVIDAPIECPMERYMALTNLVFSTRDKMLKNGCQPELRLLKLLGFGNKVEVRFDTGSSDFDTVTELGAASSIPPTLPSATLSVSMVGRSPLLLCLDHSVIISLSCCTSPFRKEAQGVRISTSHLLH
jgi:hypothetical protein